MAVLKPFPGIRPAPELAAKLAAPPYDVLSSDEARVMAQGNPVSFLHINKPEIDLDSAVDPHDPAVYRKGRENLLRFLEQGVLRRDPSARYYAYRQEMGGHRQTGLVAAASLAEYERDLIKKHEHTRPDKEEDRVNHIDVLDAQVGPVFLTYRSRKEIDAMMEAATAGEPVNDFEIDGVRHRFWVIDDAGTVDHLRSAFAEVPCLYVADGHHRSAAALRVREKRRAANPQARGDEPWNFFLAVVFPHDQLQILDYNRVVADLHGLDESRFLARLRERFELREVAGADEVKPSRAHRFGMYLGGRWYALEVPAGRVDESDPVARLDVSILQEQVLAPLLGIGNPRTDRRIDFVGGIRGMRELEKRVDGGNWAVAFACYPTSIEHLMAIADAGRVMPPKSTWFEPKPKSGLVVHSLAEARQE